MQLDDPRRRRSVEMNGRYRLQHHIQTEAIALNAHSGEHLTMYSYSSYHGFPLSSALQDPAL